MRDHTHLDRGIRDEGECPGCDDIWKAQRARLAAKVRPQAKTIRELDALADRPAPGDHGKAWCTALRDTGRDTHACVRERGHPGKHQCPLCGQEWS